MKIFGIAGHSGMGKTTLLERLIPELRAQGRSVSLIKHSHKDIEVDRPGKDSYRLREAGCGEVLLLGRGRWALMHEQRHDDEPPLEDLVARLTPCDLVLVEGFKREDFPKLEVWRAGQGKAPLRGTWPGILALAGDAATHAAGAARFALDDVPGIAAFVASHARPVRQLPVEVGPAARAGSPTGAGLAPHDRGAVALTH